MSIAASQEPRDPAKVMSDKSQIAALRDSPLILLTGAAGRIGRHVLTELRARGYRVRALTTQQAPISSVEVQWVRHDWTESIDFDEHVQDCSAVIHLGAQIWDIPKMQRINVDATRALAEAAERAKLRFFGFASSVAVYGSSLQSTVDEGSPLLTPNRDVAAEYRGNASIRAYGRSKVAAENALRAAARSCAYAVFRPTVVVDDADIHTLRKLGHIRRFIEGRRRTHHIHISDVAHAMIWFLDRALTEPGTAGTFEVFNLSDDDTDIGCYRDVYRLALQLTGDPAYRSAWHAPLSVYNLADMLKNRAFSMRYPLGQMYFPPTRLMATGYRFRSGMRSSYARVFGAGE